MVNIINGSRVTLPKPNFHIANPDPNSKLSLINNAKLITEEDKREPSAQKKIGNFRPDKLKQFSNKTRLEQVRSKQRKGDINEMVFIVKKKIATFKQQQLKGSRFAGEIGKGSIFDLTA